MTSSSPKTIGICIVTYARTALLSDTILTLQAALQKCADLKYTIVLLINGYDTVTREWVNLYRSQRNSLPMQVIELKTPVSPSSARNRLIREIDCDWYGFLDDDVRLDDQYFQNFINLIEKPARPLDIVGGPNLTWQNSSEVEKRIGWSLSQFFICGPISYRYSKGHFFQNSMSFKLSLCNLFVKSSVAKDIYFNESLYPAEENAFLIQAKKKNYNISYADQLFVWHRRRQSERSFLEQIENYGRGRGHLIAGRHQEALVTMLQVGFLLIALVILLKQPALVAAGLLTTWMILLFKYRRAFGRFSFFPIRISAQIWYNYFYGIVSGLIGKSAATIQKKFAN